MFVFLFGRKRTEEEKAAAELEHAAHTLKELEQEEDQLIALLSENIKKIARKGPILGSGQKRLTVLAKYIPSYGNRDAAVHAKLALVTRFMLILPHAVTDQSDLQNMKKLVSNLIINYGKQFHLIPKIHLLSKQQVAA